MVKTFRKLAALTAAVALVASFAVCASAAVTVNTTSTYLDADTVSVSATVTGTEGELANGAQVTYYATNAAADATAGVVHIDQAPATDGSAQFNFKTDADYLRSAVKIGYTGASAAVDSIIPGIFTLTVTDGDANTVSTYISENTDPNKTYEVNYTPAEGKQVSALTVAGGTATIVSAADGKLVFTLSGLPAVSGNIVVTVTETEIQVSTATGRVVAAGGIIAGANSNDKLDDGSEIAEGFKAAEGNRKLTVIAEVIGEGVTEYGVIVAENIDDSATTLPDARVYAAKGKADNGMFAVQLIDTENDLEVANFIVPGVEYETAVYFKVGNVYKIVKGDSVTIAAQ